MIYQRLLKKCGGMAANYTKICIAFVAIFLAGCGDFEHSEPAPTPTVIRSKEEWSKVLSPQAYSVMVEKKTEPKFRNPYHSESRNGNYYSAATGELLFTSQDKFSSNTGWPAFSKPVDKQKIFIKEDRSNGMLRQEVVESATGLHLGHVFDDGPIERGGKRFCINSAALVFIAD